MKKMMIIYQKTKFNQIFKKQNLKINMKNMMINYQEMISNQIFKKINSKIDKEINLFERQIFKKKIKKKIYFK